MATHASVLAWRIPGTGEPGGLPSLGSHRVGHDNDGYLLLITPSGLGYGCCVLLASDIHCQSGFAPMPMLPGRFPRGVDVGTHLFTPENILLLWV